MVNKSDAADAKTQADQAGAQGAADGANSANDQAVAALKAQLDEANRKAEEMSAANEKAAADRAAAENEAADLRARLAKSEAEHDSFKTAVVSGAFGSTSDDEDPDALVPVRVKTPLVINPDPRDWHYTRDGIPPAAATLVAGLNHVPRWVADHWLVRGSLEDGEQVPASRPKAEPADAA